MMVGGSSVSLGASLVEAYGAMVRSLARTPEPCAGPHQTVGYRFANDFSSNDAAGCHWAHYDVPDFVR